MRIAIIGGAGKMGRWFAEFFLKDGKEVIISGRSKEKLLEVGEKLGVDVAPNSEAVRRADVVLLSVPIESFEEVVREIAPHVRPGQVVFDITSIKVLPVEIMHRWLRQARVLGTHPLFGPGAKGLANQDFILTPTSEGERKLAEEVKEYLEARGAKVTLMTPEEHDEKMAISLGLSHFIAIVSADTLLSAEPKLQCLVGGITYKVFLTFVESVILENPELYSSIQMNLPRVPEVEELFRRKVEEWAELVKKKERQEFVRSQDCGANCFFGPFVACFLQL